MVTTMAGVDANPQPTKVSVDPQVYTATQLGEVFTININMTHVTNLKSFNFTLGYNTTLLDALDVAAGLFLQPARMPLKEINDSEGYIRASIEFAWSWGVHGNGTAAIITFNATYAGSALCALDLYDTALTDPNTQPIDHEVEDGEYKFSILGLTVTTDKVSYSPEENVTINGNLTQDGFPSQGLLAIEVNNPNNYPTVARTLQIGNTTPPGDITVVEVVPCDSMGEPKNSFGKGSLAYFNVTVRNDGAEWKYVRITVNAYDGNMVPLPDVASVLTKVSPGVHPGLIRSIPIPNWTATGNGSVYACAYTDWPRASGVPYCPEKNATFEITGSGQGSNSFPQSSGTDGNYSLTFKLANNTAVGIYRVYVSSSYLGRTLTNNTVFGVNAIYVCPNHYLTIQDAVDAATPTNNSILVCPGTYNEHVTINKSVTLVGREPGKTIINGTGTGTVVTVTANYVEINRFTIKNSGGSFPDSAITLNNSSNSVITENTILESYNGVYLANSSHENTIQGNTLASNSGYGINLHSSDNNIIQGNTLASNNNYGICINQSSYTTLEDNTLIGNRYNFGMFGDSMSDFIHYINPINPSNTVDGKPIYYWNNRENEPVPSDAGYVAIVNSANITVKGLNLTNNGNGVLLAYTTNSLIERVKTTDNNYGIYADHSSNNTIIGSEVSNNTVGIHQGNCNYNTICHNNFTNNANQTDIYQSSNTWDDGDGKGNYWNDYTGADNGSDNRPVGDGVGDTLLPHKGVDWYPLMDPWILVHDVAVINVTYTTLWLYPQVYPNWEITITVNIKNEGDFTEPFNITASYDGNHTQTNVIVTGLTPLKETTKNLTWTPTDVSPGNYTISAEASELFNETDTIDNIFIDGQVEVMLWGDVNGNGVVGSMDFGDVGKMYLIYSGIITSPPDLVARGDINGNGVVGPTDFGDVGKMYLIYSGIL
jgi:parallel beta-helix repeat protein